MADLTCGSGGSTGGEIIAQINTNTAGVEDHGPRIDDLETTVADHEGRIQDNETAIADHETRISTLEAEDPLAVMHLVNNTSISVDDTNFTVLPIFDEIVIERGGFTASTVDNSITIGKTVSACVVSIGINIEFPGTEILEVQIFVNGTSYADESFYLKGDGSTKPVALFWQSIVALNAGDVLDVRAKNAASGTLNATVERSHFSARSTAKEIV